MRTGRDILIEEGRVVALPVAGTGPGDADVIDCGGRAVTPGLIVCHWRATLVSVSRIAALTQDIAFVHLVAGQEAVTANYRAMDSLFLSFGYRHLRLDFEEGGPSFEGSMGGPVLGATFRF
ncbi:hypothetical protein P6F26_14980 [Roseibacterium sp. SDUM158017]|uniref:hypothetical protein n=1 Tax=Roseicyclus salinarum TaxID=3036773 RepID=UPI0024157A36|nr:hypothetical protein [Roseibacterium sp. SDUM158017]MDG4649747.1 hypothetical protein [Roseibacterium sp. SDUM158017]